MDHPRFRYAYLRSLCSKWDSTERRVILRCPFCNKPIPEGQGELHHWLVKRGALPKHNFDRIDLPINMLIVHHDCHMQLGQTREGFEKCRQMGISTFGKAKLTEFYNSLSDLGIKPVKSVLDL